MDVAKRHTANSHQREHFLKKWKIGKIELDGIANARKLGLVDEVTGLKTWKRIYNYQIGDVKWTVMREFFWDYDDRQARSKEECLKQYGSTFNSDDLPMLEGMDYIAYDMNNMVFAAYFAEAHIKAHGETVGKIIEEGIAHNIYQVSKWQNLGIDTSDRHGMVKVVRSILI